MKIGKTLLGCFILFSCGTATAQDLRSSLFEYQFNALPLNPAYAGRLEVPTFDAIYFGNFTASFQVSRSALVSAHGRSGGRGQFGWGGVFQFYQQDFYGELNVQPAFSRRVALPGGGTVAFGGTLGLSYFDIDEAVLTTVTSNFMALDGGFGVYFLKKNSFAGLSVLRAFEKSFFLDKTLSGSGLQRENPFNLHAGTVVRLRDNLQLKPSALLRYANVYELPSRPQTRNFTLWSADVEAGFFVEDTYLLSLLAGYTKPESGAAQSRAGISATYLAGHFRISYAIQYNSQAASGVSLPATHLVSAGYDFFRAETGVRYF